MELSLPQGWSSYRVHGSARKRDAWAESDRDDQERLVAVLLVVAGAVEVSEADHVRREDEFALA